MNLYLKHSRKYLALLRKVMKVSIHNTSYYDWSGNISLDGKWTSIAVRYTPPTYQGKTPDHRFSTKGFSTNSLREFIAHLQSQLA